MGFLLGEQDGSLKCAPQLPRRSLSGRRARRTMRTPKERDVSPSALSRPCAEASSFPELLKAWRQKRRLSQLGLALQSGVSQRHVSFLESGRARPSRTMILQLSETLEVPLRDRNDWLVAAGFAPVFRARPLDDP